MLKNDLFLRALKGEPVRRPPVWMMRQAGRYLPDFMALKNKYDFFTRCQTPELATEITIMPIDQIGPDAAILFSDILVVLQAMQIPVEMKDGIGPWIPNPIKSQADVDQSIVPDIHEHLGYVMEAVKMTKIELNERVPLIGFAGSPWTLLCYAVQGQGSKTFDKAKAFCFSQPEAAHALLQKITDTTILYLKAKVAAGVDAVQIFDSWGGLLSPEDYQLFSWPYIQQIVHALKDEIPVIVFGKGCWFALNEMAKSGASALGVDWTCSARNARYLSGGQITLQGNFDPSRLLSPIPEITEAVYKMINEFGMTHEAAADAVGKSRSSVTNLLRLLLLSDFVKEKLNAKEIDMGHARALLSLAPDQQNMICQKIIQENLSVRKVEDLINDNLNGKKTKKILDQKESNKDLKNLEKELSEKLGYTVTIDDKVNNSGQIKIKYRNLDELDILLKNLQLKV